MTNYIGDPILPETVTLRPQLIEQPRTALPPGITGFILEQIRSLEKRVAELEESERRRSVQ